MLPQCLCEQGTDSRDVKYKEKSKCAFGIREMNDFSLISSCPGADSGTVCCTGLLFPFNADAAARYRNRGDKYLCFVNYTREAPLIFLELTNYRNQLAM